jgi:hypothetical protein
MKKMYLLNLMFFSTNIFVVTAQDINNSSKDEFILADINQTLTIDKNIIMCEDRVQINKSCIFNNMYEDEINYQYNYLGSFGNQLKHVAIEKVEYNGTDYFLVEKDNCKVTELRGFPYLFENYLITVNKSRTTDYENYISIFYINKSKIDFLKKIELPKNIIVKDVKLKGQEIYLLDINDDYWKLTI